MNKNQQVTDNRATLNAQLQVLVTENDCTFANNHDLFHLKHGAINDGYYFDDSHLTLKRSDAMIKSIGLKQRSGIMSTTNIHPRHTSPLTWKIQPPTQRVHAAKQIRLREVVISTTSLSSTAKCIHPLHQIVYPLVYTPRRHLQGTTITPQPVWTALRLLTFSTPSGQRHVAKVRQKRTTQLRTGQSKTTTKDPRAHRHCDKPRTYQPPSRDQCEHCGETAHNTVRCRHGGPITCHSCGELAPKSKHCHHAQIDDYYRGYWRDA